MQFSFLPPVLPDGLDRLRGEVRQFIDSELMAGYFKPHCSAFQAFDPAFTRRVAERGYIGMTFPRQYGGHGRSFFERYVVAEELLAAGAPVSAHWIADRQSGPQILKHGTEELRRKVIPGIVRGETYFAIGMSEPEAGSDLANIRSRAHRVDGGWRLVGRKIWTTNGHRAHYIIGLFRTSARDEKLRHDGMTQFVVQLDSTRITRRPIRDMSGESDFSEITFDDVFVPDSHVLGKVGQGWSLVTAELSYERSGPERFLSVVPLLRVAAAGLVHQKNPELLREVGKLVARISVLRQMSLSVAGRLQAGELPNVEAAIVKDAGNSLERDMAEVLRRVDERRAQMGNDSFESLLASALLQAPSITLRGGTPEILKGVIARGLGLR